MLNYKKIKLNKKYIEAFCLKLGAKNLIILKGKKGYIMCGYLNLKTAEKFKDVAVKITGINTLQEALQARVSSLTSPAKRLGIFKGQPVSEVLKVIA